MPSDHVGIDVDALTPELLNDARLLYCLPNFQNPTGRCLPLPRRQALVAKAKDAGVAVVEDDPYGELSYRGETLPSLLSYDPDNGIYLGSFSKVLAPGLRLGYIVAPPWLYQKLVQTKQAADLHSPSLNQYLAYELVRDGFLEGHIPRIRQLYRDQCQLMLSALDRNFPATASWTRPQGGMFIWVTLPEAIDTQALLASAIDRGVAFVPGAPFFTENAPTNTLRLSFVTVSAERIEAGIRLLGELIRAELAR
ncbi:MULTISPECIES: PLP-dependent aminotransferase family protein [unclassified Halomonas]|uniref:aminotransferase-like domain-containing protein n=1 Tax=unclassified Halomonas TaxID=2609666 RepID=UPI001C967AEA|nr:MULTISPECIES: PLP-dependent aminotransferase family protein [unclassified Halomonas]MBY5925711.1 PLP-dependent aminotransferase family protein [Halomonas sp. DP4Y7-2]MBY6232470.1 PLP-dependent aminotransferase family protein [Halomonas sp. DP4Y7-1]